MSRTSLILRIFIKTLEIVFEIFDCWRQIWWQSHPISDLINYSNLSSIRCPNTERHKTILWDINQTEESFNKQSFDQFTQFDVCWTSEKTGGWWMRLRSAALAKPQSLNSEETFPRKILIFLKQVYGLNRT